MAKRPVPVKIPSSSVEMPSDFKEVVRNILVTEVIPMLQQTLPNQEAIAADVVKTLGRSVSRDLDTLRDNLDSRMSSLENDVKAKVAALGHGSNQSPVVPLPGLAKESTEPAPRVGFDWSAIAATIATLCEKAGPLMTQYQQSQQIKMQQELMSKDPFTIAMQIQALRPEMAPYIGMVLNPSSQTAQDLRLREHTESLLLGMRARQEAHKIFQGEPTEWAKTTIPSAGLGSTFVKPTPASTMPSAASPASTPDTPPQGSGGASMMNGSGSERSHQANARDLPMERKPSMRDVLA